jgi:hypothetical protein
MPSPPHAAAASHAPSKELVDLKAEFVLALVFDEFPTLFVMRTDVLRDWSSRALVCVLTLFDRRWRSCSNAIRVDSTKKSPSCSAYPTPRYKHTLIVACPVIHEQIALEGVDVILLPAWSVLQFVAKALLARKRAFACFGGAGRSDCDQPAAGYVCFVHHCSSLIRAAHADEDSLLAILFPVLVESGEYRAESRVEDLARRFKQFAVVLPGWKGHDTLTTPEIVLDKTGGCCVLGLQGYSNTVAQSILAFALPFMPLSDAP